MPDFLPARTPIRELFFAAIDRSIAFVELGPDGMILDANPNYLGLCGYSLEELVGKNHKALCSAEDILSPKYTALWQDLHEGKSVADLFLRQRKDGSSYWLEAVYTPVISPTGEIDRIIALGVDVTNRQETIQGKLAWLETLNRATVMAEFRHNGEIVAVNDTFTATLGHQATEIAGKKFTVLFAADSSVDTEHIWNTLRAGQPYTATLPLRAADGSERFHETAFVPDFDDTGKMRRVVLAATDAIRTRAPESGRLEEMRHQAIASANTDAAIMVTDKNRRIVYVNDGFTRLYGYQRHEVKGKTPRFLYGSADKEIETKQQRALTHSESLRTDILTYARNGRCFWTAAHMNPILDEKGEPRMLVAVHVDNTEAKMHEVLLHKALSALALDVPIPKVLSSLCREVEHLLPDTAIAIFGVNNEEQVYPIAFPSLPKDFAHTFESSEAPRLSVTARALRSRKIVIQMDLECDAAIPEVKKNLLDFDIRSCWSMPIKDASGKAIGAITFYYKEKREPDPFHLRIVNVLQHLCSLALERSRTSDTMRRMSFYDELTGLPNRNLLCTRAERLITKAMRLNKPIALFHIGLDRFKRFNDTLGHGASDFFLRTIGERLSEKYRDPTIVSRVISDEFILVCYDCDANHAAGMAERIQEMIRTPSMMDGITITTTASIGISLFPENGTSINELLHNADLAMHQAKAAGRAQYSFFSMEENSKAKAKLSLETHLREAVTNRKFHLFYQPKIWLNGKGLYGVEALARWNSEEYGDIPPGQFIPLAEETGLITELGRWTIKEACRQMSAWQAKNIRVPSVAVNLSPSSFRDETLPDFIRECLEKNKLQPPHLILELTEDVLLDNDPETLRTIFRAHEMGIRLSMDDFGTGYSSLSYLRQLPISELKLDKSFVQGIDKDKTSQNLGKAVMHIAESLSLTVVAEGVESPEEYHLLKNLGYHAIQGYFSASPLSPVEFENWHQVQAPAFA
ncbi:EAL domain-containing protein [Desulfovibrio sp. OttesenSCG-928-O18]|nr:EAL domain-containing protein [Desulfovibrio sp. OttesenSCG-928-O18]